MFLQLTYFEPIFFKSYCFHERDIMQLFSAYATISSKKMKKKFFFADENMKKMSSKVDHKRPISFSMYLLTIGQKPVQISISVP